MKSRPGLKLDEAARTGSISQCHKQESVVVLIVCLCDGYDMMDDIEYPLFGFD